MSKLPENHDVIIVSKDYGLGNWNTSDLLAYRYELKKMFIDILCQEIASRIDADDYNSIGEKI